MLLYKPILNKIRHQVITIPFSLHMKPDKLTSSRHAIAILFDNPVLPVQDLKTFYRLVFNYLQLSETSLIFTI